MYLLFFFLFYFQRYLSFSISNVVIPLESIKLGLSLLKNKIRSVQKFFMKRNTAKVASSDKNNMGPKNKHRARYFLTRVVKRVMIAR